jgi:gliding motility-associated-like protein
VPTAFSPNGDGVNDYFAIYGGIDVQKVKRFMVFDRLGEMIFDAKDFFPNDPRHGWDGKLREEIMNTSVFVYYLEVEFKDGAVEEFKGDVTLVK